MPQEVWLRRSRKFAVPRRGAVRALADAPDGADLLRFFARHQRNREMMFYRVEPAGGDWLERVVTRPERLSKTPPRPAVIGRVMEQLSRRAGSSSRAEIEERSVRNRELTGWSVPLVKVRAFRARAEMKTCLSRWPKESIVTPECGDTVSTNGVAWTV